MIEGLWTIKFITNVNTWGSGVLVLTKGGRILGGDMGYYYIGTYNMVGTKITGKIDIIQFEPQCMSVFGDVSNFQLDFVGSLVDENFHATANSTSFPGNTLNIEGNKKEDLTA